MKRRRQDPEDLNRALTVLVGRFGDVVDQLLVQLDRIERGEVKRGGDDAADRRSDDRR